MKLIRNRFGIAKDIFLNISSANPFAGLEFLKSQCRLGAQISARWQLRCGITLLGEGKMEQWNILGAQSAR